MEYEACSENNFVQYMNKAMANSTAGMPEDAAVSSWLFIRGSSQLTTVCMRTQSAVSAGDIPSHASALIMPNLSLFCQNIYKEKYQQRDIIEDGFTLPWLKIWRLVYRSGAESEPESVNHGTLNLLVTVLSFPEEDMESKRYQKSTLIMKATDSSCFYPVSKNTKPVSNSEQSWVSARPGHGQGNCR